MQTEMVRIESTRKNIVVLPPVYNQPEAKPNDTEAERHRKRRAIFKATLIESGKWDGQSKVVEPRTTFVKRAYIEAVKDIPEVKRLFTPSQNGDGCLRIVDSDDAGSTPDASAPELLPSNDAQATVIINACSDLEQLYRWAGSTDTSRDDVFGSLSARIAIVESAQKRGEAPTGK